LEASLLFGDQDYESALSLNNVAADGEKCVFYRAEFKLFEAVCLVNLKRFAEAAPLCKEVLKLTHESRWFRLIEPKLYSLANFFAWAALRENGELTESLSYLEAAARTEWSKSGRCQCWKDLVEDAMAAGDLETARRAFRMMSRDCNPNDVRYTELAETLSRWNK
jgi:tetratricopeptide (TPR) repeat protein